MTFNDHIRQNWQLAYPVMLSHLGHVMMSFTDNVMVGHVGVVPLAAAGLATVIFNVLLLFGIGVSYAITTFVASAHGQGDDHKITETLRHGLVINLINSFVLILIVSVGKNLLYHLNQPPEVVEQAVPYLSIITYSLIPMLIFQSFKQFAEGLSRTRVAMVVMLLTNVINVALNYLLIFGHGGFPAMGLEGAGWATLISRVFMAVAITLFVFFSPVFSAYRQGFLIGKYSGKLFRTMLHIGIPSGVQFIFEAIAFDFSLVMMGWIGAVPMAAHQVVINMATISYMTTSGLAAAATIRVGYFLGKKEIGNVYQAARASVLTAVIMMLLWATLFISLRNSLPAIYNDNAEVIEIASTLLVIAALFQLSDGVQVVCTGALRGMRDVKIPSLLIFVAYWIVGLPLGYVLAFQLNVRAVGIWIGLLTGLTVTAVAMYFRLSYIYRIAINN